MKMSLCCFLFQQNLISIQRQKSEVLAATASFYDSFLDVIEFRVTVSMLIYPKIHWRTRRCSDFGFYLLQSLMQKIPFDKKDNRSIFNAVALLFFHHLLSYLHILRGTCTTNSVLIPHKYVNIIEKSSEYTNVLASCISNKCAAPPLSHLCLSFRTTCTSCSTP